MPPKLPYKQTEATPQGRQTQVQGVDTIQRQAQKDAADRRQALGSLLNIADQLNADAQESFKKSRLNIRSLQEMDTSARDAANKSAAQDIVMKHKLAMDAELQKLEFDPNVKPLDLHRKATEIIKSSSNMAVTEGTDLGSEMMTYIRQKLTDYEFEQVPKYRKMGYDKQQSKVLGEVQDRMYARKVEMGKKGLPAEKRAELMQESIADIMSIRGTFLSDEDAQKQINGLRDDFKKQAILDLAEADTNGALRAADALDILPDERLALKSQIYSIVNQRNSERDRAEAAEKKARDTRAEALENEFTRRIIASNYTWNPMADLANPEVAAALVTGDRARAIQNFYDKMSGTEAARNKPPAIQEMGHYLAIQQGINTGAFRSREDLTRYLTDNMDRLDLTRGDIGNLTSQLDSRIERIESEDRRQVNELTSVGEKTIGTFTSALSGRGGRHFWKVEPQVRAVEAQINSSFSNAVIDATNKAKEQGLDPRVVVNPTALAHQAVADAWPLLKPIYAKAAGEIDHAGLRQLVGNAVNLGQSDTATIESLKAAVSREAPNMTQKQLTSTRSMIKLLEAMGTMSGQTNSEGQPVTPTPAATEPEPPAEPIPATSGATRQPVGGGGDARSRARAGRSQPKSIMTNPPKGADTSEKPAEKRATRNANRGLFGTR